MLSSEETGTRRLRDGWARGPAYWGMVGAVAVVYFGAAKLGLSMATLAEQVSPVWPPTGIALAAVVLLGRRIWPAIALGAFVANATANEPLMVAAGIAAGNTAEALLGAWLLERGGRFRPSLDGVHDALKLIALAATVATALCATVGVTSLCLGGLEPWSRFPALWEVWWVGDAMGALVMAPLLFTWLTPVRPPWPRRLSVEVVVLIAMLAGVCAIAFNRRFGPGEAPGPTLEYTVFPFLVWGAVRGGARAATLVTFTTSAVAISSMLAGSGPFAAAPPEQGLVLLQTYMGLLAITGLVLAAAVAERNRVERERAEASERAQRELRHEVELREAAQEQLRQRAQQLADADSRKNEFLAMLGHELRNPLGAMSNAIHVLRSGPVPLSGGRMLEVIDRQVRHLTRLVGDLLEVARITRGELSLRAEALDLASVVARAVDTAQPWVEERGQRLTFEREARSLPTAGDPTRLEQVFANLLHNAAKYTGTGGSIVVRAACEGRTAVVRVRDDGVGIAPELLPRVFEPFTQGDQSLDRSAGGLGIGLTLAQRIIHLHGGTIEAASDGVGRGSEFVVRLPLSEVIAAPAGAETAPRGGSVIVGQGRMLVVDDQPDAAEGLAELMRYRGYETQIALDGGAALALAAAHEFDVVLLDLGLPGLDGFEVARRIRELPGVRDALLIAVSGYARDEDRSRSRAAGIDHHLVKPVDVAELERLLSEPIGAGER